MNLVGPLGGGVRRSPSVLFVSLQRLLGLKRHIRADRLVVLVVFFRLVGGVRAFLSGQTPQQDGDGAEENQQHDGDDTCKERRNEAQHL